MRNLGFCLYFFSFTQTTCNNLCEYFFNLLQLFLNFFLTFLNLFQSYSYMYIHVLPFSSWPLRAWPKGGGGTVTTHTRFCPMPHLSCLCDGFYTLIRKPHGIYSVDFPGS